MTIQLIMLVLGIAYGLFVDHVFHWGPWWMHVLVFMLGSLAYDLQRYLRKR